MSTKSKPRSIASQLILLFTLAAVLLVAFGLGIFYWLVVRHAFAEDNAVLADKLTALSADFAASGPKAFAEGLRSHRADQQTPFWTRLLDAEGKIVGETPGMNHVLSPGVFPPGEKSPLTMQNPKDHRAAGKLFSLAAVEEQFNGQRYTIQLAQDRTSDEKVERNFGYLLLIVLLCSMFASRWIAGTVTKRGLRPLEEITQTVHRIGPTHLNERVAATGWPGELQPLALAFDDMLERLNDSFTRLSQFSADLAHELRTPVANMLGEAQVALTRERSSPEYRATIESIIGECERLSGIVDNLLFLARADAAREPVACKWFDARTAAEKIAAFYQMIADDRHVSIRCEGGGQIYADPALFERAVGNLLDNALRFAPEKSCVSIKLAERPAVFEVAISDHGPGIGPEHLPRVFDRFYRAESSRSTEGTGLGLALVKSIVQLHGGSATIQSELGKGTTVRLFFPKPDAPRDPANLSEQRAATAQS